jgi:hypothetical protein
VRPGNSWDLRSCRQQPGESLQEYIQRFLKQRLVSKLGHKTPTKASELMDIATKFASGQEAVEAIFRRTSSLRGANRKTSPRRPPSRARIRRRKRSRKRSATPPTQILSLMSNTGTLGSLPEGPTCSISCSRSRAPITRVPSSTP